ncbi:hemolysin III family protein [Carboxydochorda subterranea]|uniref:Hemolysin III family protein n=1 Tax=Carboxydichorda subterranea TaxID=3109565 RepID=A0ABZ1BUL3_9FIRM|nr:hemolysin III family protein [Limnochorda sp. L945t]WRP16278.1 hemolysin III family protein [Limnochorda sp. L945t]
MTVHLREPVSGLTHAAGAVLSIGALVLLVRTAASSGSVWAVVGFALFGASLILLYTASALYHLLPLPARGTAILRRIDHSMIYVLIAGTYSPILLAPLRGAWGWSLFALVWTLAAIGITLKVFWFGTPRWLTVLFYVGLGLLVIPMLPLLLRAVPAGTLTWIGIGGLFYLAGAAVYALKWPRLAVGRFGFHELFHLLVMAGSFSHFWGIWAFLLPR